MSELNIKIRIKTLNKIITSIKKTAKWPILPSKIFSITNTQHYVLNIYIIKVKLKL